MMPDHLPRFFFKLFKWFCRPELFDELQGDLEEAFHENKVLHGLPKARSTYKKEVIRMIRPSVIKILKSDSKINHLAMLKNFYTVTIRNLAKHKQYLLINTFGLGLGIASFTLIALYVVNETSYDTFHPDHDNIYRVNNVSLINGTLNRSALTAGTMGRVMIEDFPEVVNTTRLVRSKSLLMGKGGKKFIEEKVLYADTSFLKVFDFRLLKGNPETALVEPKSMILTESYALKYFGYEEPLGKKVTIDDDSTFYTITGVIEDVPSNSHIDFDILASVSTHPKWNRSHWVGNDQYVYAVLEEGASSSGLEQKMRSYVKKYYAPEIERYTGLSYEDWKSAGQGNSISFELIPIKEIHLKSTFSGELEPGGNMVYVYIYTVTGIIILLVAIFNFVNLATAHSVSRRKEVGIRKVVGSTKSKIVFQFLFESMIVAFLATLTSLVLISLAKPYFIHLVGKTLAVGLFSSWSGPLALVGIIVIVGVLAGVYPALVLSSFNPIAALKGGSRGPAKAGWLRNLLVTLQFVASIVIIIGTLVIYGQIDYMISRNLGFDKDQILVIERPDGLRNNMEVFKEDLSAKSNIKLVANSETLPGKSYKIRSYRKKDDATTFLFKNNQVTYDHQGLLGLELAQGRFFSKDYGDDADAIIINETAARQLGFEDAIGKKLTSAFRKGEILTVIGVVKDYNISSLHHAIEPVTLEIAPKNNKGFLSIKLASNDNVRETIDTIDEAWRRYAGDRPMQYFFFDEDYQNLYKSESTTGRVFIFFAGLSIVIACLGLVGLISYTTSVRRKEIGIRKVLGAGTGMLIQLLSKPVLRLILVATLISWPLAYFATDQWLQNFADRISINPGIYFGGHVRADYDRGVGYKFSDYESRIWQSSGFSKR